MLIGNERQKIKWGRKSFLLHRYSVDMFAFSGSFGL